MTWPTGFGGGTFIESGVNAAASNGVTVTAGSSHNTKGAYAELIASTAQAADGFYLWIRTNASGANEQIIDIALGAAGSEVIIVPDIQFSSRGAADPRNLGVAYIPIPIPKATRVSVRAQGTANSTMNVGLATVAGDFYAAMRCSKATSYGVDLTDSMATEFDPGGSAHTKGAWSQLSASVEPMRYLLLSISQKSNAAQQNQLGLLDIGIGAAGSEQVIVPDVPYATNGAETIVNPWYTFPVSVATGQRLAVRGQSSITDATDRLMDASVVGFS